MRHSAASRFVACPTDRPPASGRALVTLNLSPARPTSCVPPPGDATYRLQTKTNIRINLLCGLHTESSCLADASGRCLRSREQLVADRNSESRKLILVDVPFSPFLFFFSKQESRYSRWTRFVGMAYILQLLVKSRGIPARYCPTKPKCKVTHEQHLDTDL
ncbi:hypothetical protein E2C01_050858 [Portunus trituberculatus]|uniref:Uncharacterized protein n=1 Tax=Portunus trituberculatus TaxID=210409 RepID=A0A5B7GD76_PORTR|nr:hypothetical protein [Portunus trituberculatus]